MQTLDALIDKLWQEYSAANPQAATIHAAFSARGERVVNDHIALRTFDMPAVNIGTLSQAFCRFGYAVAGHYDFTAKKLRACHFEHPDETRPLIFISELRTGEFSSRLQQIITELVSGVPDGVATAWDFPVAGVVWPRISYTTYETLRNESEYAAWTAAFGFCANHFTVSLNALTTFDGIHAVNAFIEKLGYPLNTAGGVVKGSREQLLEQSSTLAADVVVDFADGVHTIPGRYYEFARRYPRSDGTLFRGFIAQSADKIFESTNSRSSMTR